MKFSTAVLFAGFIASVSPVPIKRAVDPRLIPEFGFTAGINPTGTGDCDGAVKGANGKPIKIPCSCPPNRQVFIDALNKNVAAGKAVNNPSVAVSFPTDNSKASQEARINTAIVTLQNLNGPGKGCPAASTTFSAQQKAIQNGSSLPPASSGPPAASPPRPGSPPAGSRPSPSPPPAPQPIRSSAAAPAASGAAGNLDLATLDKLTPQFGVKSGQNPTGTGDCDGINGIKVPCSCPPDRKVFIESLRKNVAAGKVVNNPSVAVSFPTDNSKASQEARINTAIVTLQNLNGPGKGCPAASTTFSAQQKAIQNSSSPPPASSAPPAASPPRPGSPPAGSRPSPSPPPAPQPIRSSAAAPAASGAAGNLDLATLDKLTPQFGVKPGQNPTGTGDCDGINGIKIPCSCPPDRQTFLQSLQRNIAAGKATNNPSVKVSFPTDNSAASQRTRIESSITTLQNLNGEGKGCPAVSTTFSSQLAAIKG